MDVQITENEPAHRFEVVIDGEVAGFSEYDRRDGAYVFTHTEVDEKYEGEGLGSALVRGALDAMHERHATVIPRCPFVRKFIAEHDDYADLLPAA